MSLPAVPSRPERLVGFDNVGEVFSSEGRILRGIYPGHRDRVREILSLCEKAGLADEGLIEAREIEAGDWSGYEMVLEHPRVPFVSHPHEWPASMFKASALFHIDLFQKLASHGLTLKDWHPANILFRGTAPVFVDFTSVVRIDDLPVQAHLAPRHSQDVRAAASWDDQSRAVYQMYRLMFEPYFGLPLVMMEKGRHALARKRVFETTLNSVDDVISRRESFEGDKAGRLLYEIEERFRMRTLGQDGPVKSRFFDSVRRVVARRDVALRGSAYSSYYKDKGEAFSFEPNAQWTAKQHGVHSALARFKPRTVLDLGCNTGWFSTLAARSGSSVVAVDIDEASVDHLYLAAVRDGLDILPLVANLADPLPEIFPRKFEDEPSLSLIGDGEPLVTLANRRLQSEMVIALAVTHHLSLGQGKDFGKIAAMFDGLATRYLCVEFVSMDDPMIASDAGFFPAYAASPASFNWYSEQNLMAELRKYFSSVESVGSYPETRRLLVCAR